MNHVIRGATGAAALLALCATDASALGVWADLDPSTPGIQSSLTVPLGATFTVDIVLVGDGTSVFDVFELGANFNDAGPVLGLAGGSGMPTAGSIAAPPGSSMPIELFTMFPVAPGAPLSPLSPTAAIAGFAGQSPSVGLCPIAVSGCSFPGFPFYGGAGVPLPGPPVPPPSGPPFTDTLFSMTFDALSTGTSAIMPFHGTGIAPLVPPTGLYALVFPGGYFPVPAAFVPGTVMVTSPAPAVPLPAPALLLAGGLFALGFAAKRRGVA